MLGPSEETGALGALGTQQAAPRPNSPGRRSFPVSHFGVGPGEATHHCPQGPGGHFLCCPFWGVAGCPAWGHPWPARERRRLEALGSGPLVLGSPRQLRGRAAGGWGGGGGGGGVGTVGGRCRGFPGSHLGLPTGFLNDFLSSSLRSSRAGKTGPGARCPGACTGPTASGRPQRQPPSSPPPNTQGHTGAFSFLLLGSPQQESPGTSPGQKRFPLDGSMAPGMPTEPVARPLRTLGLSTF